MASSYFLRRTCLLLTLPTLWPYRDWEVRKYEINFGEIRN